MFDIIFEGLLIFGELLKRWVVIIIGKRYGLRCLILRKINEK